MNTPGLIPHIDITSSETRLFAYGEELDPALLFRGELLVDGVPIFRSGVVFDLAHVLAAGDHPSANFWPLTCSCGEAGCAGIFHEAELAVGWDVRWRLTDEHRRWLTDAGRALATEDGEHLVLRFDRMAYRIALQQMRKQLLKTAHGQRLPVVLAPWDFEGIEASRLSAELSARAKQARSHEAHEVWMKTVQAALGPEWFRFDFPDIGGFDVSPMQLLSALTEVKSRLPWWTPPLGKQILRNLVPLLRGNMAGLRSRLIADKGFAVIDMLSDQVQQFREDLTPSIDWSKVGLSRVAVQE